MNWGQELQAQISAWGQENQSSATAAPIKRTALGSGDLPERGAKRAKTVDADDVMSDEAMRKAFDKNEVAKVSVHVQENTWTTQCNNILCLRDVAYYACIENMAPIKRDRRCWEEGRLSRQG